VQNKAWRREGRRGDIASCLNTGAITTEGRVPLGVSATTWQQAQKNWRAREQTALGWAGSSSLAGLFPSLDRGLPRSCGIYRPAGARERTGLEQGGPPL
jgi:hypothetical protein